MSRADYNPDPAAVPQGLLATALLSQRDLALRLPINVINHPSVVLSQACFARRRYEDQAVRKCLSNLLATGFRRFVLDIYWDAGRGQWSLCPVAIPLQLSGPSTSSAAESPPAISTTVLSASDLASSGNIVARTVGNSSTEYTDPFTLPARLAQGTLSTITSIPEASLASSSPLSSISTPASAVPETSNLFRLGEYQCTSTVTIALIRNVFQGHFTDTGTNLNATMKYLILNLHIAQDLFTQEVHTDAQAQAFGPPLSDVFNASLSPFIYTPDQLASQRADLNASWFSTSPELRPDTMYYSYAPNPSGIATTDDGWPSEAYAELTQARRLLIGFGDLDLGDSQYDTAADGGVIFAPGELSAFRTVAFSSNGTVTDGCLVGDVPRGQPQNNSFALPSSRSLSTLSNSSDAIYHSATSLSECGFSPLLNNTLTSSADVDVGPYTQYVQASLWAWQSGQPMSSTDSNIMRCVAMDLTAPQGRWQVTPCTTRLSGACRVAGQPYKWTLSTQRGPYGSMARVCPSNTSFAVPRTPLENSFARSVLASLEDLSTRSEPQADESDASNMLDERQSDPSDTLVWLDLNDLDVQGCFVQGVNSNCPYTLRAGDARRRVIVPVVAAVIVFALAGLLVFVKCAAHRAGNKRMRRRGRQKDERGDYEGVPS